MFPLFVLPNFSYVFFIKIQLTFQKKTTHAQKVIFVFMLLAHNNIKIFMKKNKIIFINIIVSLIFKYKKKKSIVIIKYR